MAATPSEQQRLWELERRVANLERQRQEIRELIRQVAQVVRGG